MKETAEKSGFLGIRAVLFAVGFALIIAGVIRTVDFSNGDDLFWLGIGILIVTAILIPFSRWRSREYRWRNFRCCRSRDSASGLK